jgi:hypothetical protein
MLDAHLQSYRDRSRFHGSLVAGLERWEVYFVDVRRRDLDWVVDCVAVGPRTVHATIRCRAEVNHYQTAHRVMSALRTWLEGSDHGDTACLDVPEAPGTAGGVGPYFAPRMRAS